MFKDRYNKQDTDWSVLAGRRVLINLSPSDTLQETIVREVSQNKIAVYLTDIGWFQTANIILVDTLGDAPTTNNKEEENDN